MVGCDWVRGIDWDRVLSEYDGIEIAPHQEDLRVDPKFRWYWAWDSAGGCIWNLGAIASFGPPYETGLE